MLRKMCTCNVSVAYMIGVLRFSGINACSCACICCNVRRIVPRRLALAGETTYGMRTAEIQELIKGPVGSKVVLDVSNPDGPSSVGASALPFLKHLHR